MNINSKFYSLADIVAENPQWYFNIPIYQRLFVWSEDQVLTLLNDLINAYERNEDIFFLGSTLLVEQEDNNGRHFDLIDGQQRFTTLWLTCNAWGKALEPFCTVHTTPRLRFAIRDEVNQFIESLTFNRQPIPDTEATQRMSIALDLINSVFAKRPLPANEPDRDEYLSGLTKFVFKNVKFVITTVPRETDLNKLFEVINNRGVQLQHHEILKARMLDALDEIDRGPYALLWEACADMEHFIERNLSGISELSANEVAALYKQKKLHDASLVRTRLHERMQAQSNHYSLSLTDILEADKELLPSEITKNSENPASTVIRSIFGFPLFLQHTLRIWLFENNLVDLPRLLDRELLQLFDEHFFQSTEKRKENVRSFIDLLWRLRFIFDKYIIKWVDQGEEEIHLISMINLSESGGKLYISRSTHTNARLRSAFSLLQSMLYHSQEITTQYWVTPLLLFIHRNLDKKTEDYFAFLRHLDNHLLGSEPTNSLIERTRSFMEEPWQQRILVHEKELLEAKGVKFAHYWFYKLEFVLWFLSNGGDDKKWFLSIGFDEEKWKNIKKKWKNFRLTAKSSVEHISPQNPTKRDDNLVDQALNHFGNLALVSRSLNSEYGNLPYNEKRQKFINKNTNTNRLDSLKMCLIYEKNEQWNDDKAFEHQNEMIGYLNSYMRNVNLKNRGSEYFSFRFYSKRRFLGCFPMIPRFTGRRRS